MDGAKREFPHLPERLAGLEELAENLWWCWHPAARMTFKLLNRQVWKESIHNPDKMLRDLPLEVLERAAADPKYLRHYDVVLSQFHKYMERHICPMLRHVCEPDTPAIVYFSAEYGLHHSLPFYAGGLGFLAGDYLKECSDLNVPLVAVGFMYPEGYVQQRIREDGWQESRQQILDREAASISRVLDADGRPLEVKVPLIDPPIYVTVWKVAVGRVSLYLLDTDIERNDPWNRSISARLYTGDLEQRLRQEIVLGIGGTEVLEVLGIRHAVLHLNEGHAAFALLERIRDRLLAGADLETAMEQVRKTTVFTTHTPVAAGHDVFPFPLMEKYFSSYWPALGLSHDDFLALGIRPDEPQAGFNMTAFAMRMSGFRNGVSRRHAEVSRQMWQCLWPDRPLAEVPIDYVTNGVHLPTWIEPKMELLFNRYMGTDWLADHDNLFYWELVNEIPDRELWDTHLWLKRKLLEVVREAARLRWTRNHASSSLIMTGGVMLDPSVLTIGFARRFVTYKRAELLFEDMDRLLRLVTDRWRPVQIIFAGKAHPADDPGKLILQKIFNAARDPRLAGRIAFVEDYGEQLAQYLVHGVDVWLNNPLPPMEACGTSGMKAGLNGVPSLSIMDGWWWEGHNGRNGWAFEHTDDDAAAIYRLLEEQVIPLYYQVDGESVPSGWVRMMKEAIRVCGTRYSARRMVKEYVNRFYAPALLEALK